jgi:hypothetical protein
MLVAAPSRQFKTYSMWIAIALGVFDLTHAFLVTLHDTQLVSDRAFVWINAIVPFVIALAKLVRQQIEMTAADKEDLIVAAAAQPTKPGEPIVTATVSTSPSTLEGFPR